MIALVNGIQQNPHIHDSKIQLTSNQMEHTFSGSGIRFWSDSWYLSGATDDAATSSKVPFMSLKSKGQ